jgi:hypothetical protein
VVVVGERELEKRMRILLASGGLVDAGKPIE